MPANEHFTTTVTIDHWPYCPVCGRPLTPGGTHFIFGYAFCCPCAEGPPAPIAIAREVLRQSIMHRYTVTKNGLYWYANHDGATTGIDAVRLFTRITGQTCLIDGNTGVPIIVEDVNYYRGHKPAESASEQDCYA